MEVIITLIATLTLLSNAAIYLKLRNAVSALPQYIDLEPFTAELIQTAGCQWCPQGCTHGAGILVIPDDIELPETTEAEDTAASDEFVQRLTEAMSKALRPKPPLHTTDDLIPDYDNLTQEDIIYLLPRLTPLAINAVRNHESANLRRQPVLACVENIIRNHYRPLIG